MLDDDRSVQLHWKEAMNVEEEVERLKEEIKRLGIAQDDGSYKVVPFYPFQLHIRSVMHFLWTHIINLLDTLIALLIHIFLIYVISTRIKRLWLLYIVSLGISC